MLQVNLSMKAIYEKLCPKCKEEMEKMVKEQMEDQLVKKMLQEGE